jgi:uncharacterized protein YegP (UPF0339 family)
MGDNIEGDFYLYRSGILIKGWRWRFVSDNGHVIYSSTESYHNKDDCIRTIPILAGETTRSWREE